MNSGKKHVEEMGLERLRAGTEGGMGDRSSRRLFCSLGGGALCRRHCCLIWPCSLGPSLSSLQFHYLQGWIKSAAMRQARS